jgi:hypothetical protein
MSDANGIQLCAMMTGGRWSEAGEAYFRSINARYFQA